MSTKVREGSRVVVAREALERNELHRLAREYGLMATLRDMRDDARRRGVPEDRVTAMLKQLRRMG